MVSLEVYSNPERPEVLCSLVDERGNKKEIMLIKLQDNGVHVYKTEEHYILPPIPQINSLIKNVIEEVAEELKVDSIVYNYGNIDTNSETLILSNDWFDIERLALASSKHVALSSDVESKIIVSIVKFSDNAYAATVLRREDSFPILQVFMDASFSPPLIKIYNELGQNIETRRENINNFDEYVKSLINEDEYTLIYREFIEYNPLPAESSTSDGKKIYAGCIFKYLIGFNVENKAILIKKRKLARLLRAILYLDRLSKSGGVDIIIGNPVSVSDLSQAIVKLKNKVNNAINKKFKINNIYYYGANLELIKESNIASNKNILNVVPIAFVIIADSKKKFEEYVERILSGPKTDGLELLDEYIRQDLSNTFISYLASLEELLILYNDIIRDLDDNESDR
ncbi:MAG: hypothetical protein QXW51_04980 [Sulfolobaceae archaeon]